MHFMSLNTLNDYTFNETFMRSVERLQTLNQKLDVSVMMMMMMIRETSRDPRLPTHLV